MVIRSQIRLPKRRFWKTEQQVGRVFSMYFARVCTILCSPNRFPTSSFGEPNWSAICRQSIQVAIVVGWFEWEIVNGNEWHTPCLGAYNDAIAKPIRNEVWQSRHVVFATLVPLSRSPNDVFRRPNKTGVWRDFWSWVCFVRKMTYPIRRGYFSEMLFPTWSTSGLGCTHFTMNEEFKTKLKGRLTRLRQDITSGESLLFVYADAASPTMKYHLDDVEYGLDATEHLLKIYELINPLNSRIQVVYFCWNERVGTNGIIEYVPFDFKPDWHHVSYLIQCYLERRTSNPCSEQDCKDPWKSRHTDT